MEKKPKSKKLQYIQEIRKITAASMAICRNAVEEAMKQHPNNDVKILKTAKEIVVKSGNAIINKKVGNKLGSFKILQKYNSKTNTVRSIKFGAETDQAFPAVVGENKSSFEDFCEEVIKIADKNDIDSVNELLEQKYEDKGDHIVLTKLLEFIKGLGENLEIVSMKVTKVPSHITGEVYQSYYSKNEGHSDNILGSAVLYTAEKRWEDDNDIWKLLSQLAITKPICLKEEDLLETIKEHQCTVIKEQIRIDEKKEYEQAKLAITTEENAIKFIKEEVLPYIDKFLDEKIEVDITYDPELKEIKEDMSDDDKKEAQNHNADCKKTVKFLDITDEKNPVEVLPPLGPKITPTEQIKEGYEKKLKNHEKTLEHVQKVVKEYNPDSEILDKIIEGKLNKWIKEVTFLNQTLFEDKKKTISDLCKEKGIEIVAFDTI